MEPTPKSVRAAAEVRLKRLMATIESLKDERAREQECLREYDRDLAEADREAREIEEWLRNAP